jgi:hypothetical protein
MGEPAASAAFAVVRDVAASWATYPSWGLGRDGRHVPGLILHAAGPTDEGVRTVDVWATRQQWRDHQRRCDEVLPSGLTVPPTTRELVVVHLVTDLTREGVDRATDQGGPESCR